MVNGVCVRALRVRACARDLTDFGSCSAGQLCILMLGKMKSRHSTVLALFIVVGMWMRHCPSFSSHA